MYNCGYSFFREAKFDKDLAELKVLQNVVILNIPEGFFSFT